MSVIVPIEAAERDLKSLLDRLQTGATITLVGSEGAPEALLVSVKAVPADLQPVSDWETRWGALTQRVSQAWKSEKSAVGTLAEMRR